MTALETLRRWTSRTRAPSQTRALDLTPIAAARSHVGRVRELNEDRFLARTDRGLWAVADGMGGHAAGGEAAETAVAALARVADMGKLINESVITATLTAANRQIREMAAARHAMSGATVVVAWLSGASLSIHWAGDSRAYLRRSGRWRCLTRDHSVTQELLDRGEITREEADCHPSRHIVTRALGAAELFVPEHVTVSCEAGDRILLCSDGVSRTLDLSTHHSIRIGSFVDEVLSAALMRDGSDNATLIGIDLLAGSAGAESEEVP